MINKKDNIESGLITYLNQRSIKYSGCPPKVVVTCPCCKKFHAVLYTSSGTWQCKECGIYGDFGDYQKLFFGKLDVTNKELLALSSKTTLSGNQNVNSFFQQKLLKKIIHKMHSNLLKNRFVMSVITNKLGLSKENIEKFELGWTGNTKLPFNCYYYRNRLAIPVVAPSNEILSIRFWLIPMILNVSSQSSQVLNLQGWNGSTCFNSDVWRKQSKVWMVGNEIEVIRLSQDIACDSNMPIRITSPITKGFISPMEWQTVGYVSDSGTIFVPNLKYKIHRAVAFAQSMIPEPKIAILPEQYSSVSDLLNSLQPDEGIKLLVNLETTALSVEEFCSFYKK